MLNAISRCAAARRDLAWLAAACFVVPPPGGGEGAPCPCPELHGAGADCRAAVCEPDQHPDQDRGDRQRAVFEPRQHPDQDHGAHRQRAPRDRRRGLVVGLRPTACPTPFPTALPIVGCSHLSCSHQGRHPSSRVRSGVGRGGCNIALPDGCSAKFWSAHADAVPNGRPDGLPASVHAAAPPDTPPRA